MNAQAVDAIDIDPLDTIDPRISYIARGLHRVRRWVFFPYGYWTEADGSFVIFDRRYRPLCRKRPDGSIEVLPVVSLDRPQQVKFKSQHFLYSGGYNHACENEETQRRLLGIVKRLGIEAEIIRRYELSHRDRADRRRRFLRHYR